MLFISHSSKDNPHAIRVREWLRSQGWADVFLDLDPAQGLAPGHRWQEELKRAGEKCSAVVVLVSPSWVASRWCQTEFLVADQLGKRIFPVFVEPTSFDDLPLELKAKFQLADISTPEKERDGFQRLALGLKRAGLDPRSFDWPPPNEPRRSVYRGLQPLDIQDAAIFFGRNAATTRGLDELRRLRDGAKQRMMVILGASGAGKSSFLRAGLLARLKRDEENFLVLPIVRPERAAITSARGLGASLSAAAGRTVDPALGPAILVEAFEEARRPVMERLRRHAEAARETYSARPPTIILPIDQAEELFEPGNAECALFCEVVSNALAQDQNVLVVVTIRTDSYEPLQKGLMPDEQAVFTLPPIAAGSFQEVIEGPARLATPPLTIDPELTQRLLADLSASDALPLLAFTLERLQVQYGQDGKLTLFEYTESLGGVVGAVQSAVDAALAGAMGKDALAQARALFVPALVQVHHDGVRRRVARKQDIPEALLPLAERFVDQRLLTADRRIVAGVETATIEVAHEAILRNWLGLASWINEEREALVTLDGIRAAANDWGAREVAGKEQEIWLVHRSKRLKHAQSVLLRPDFIAAVDEPMRKYLAACRKAEQRSRGKNFLASAAVAAGIVVVGGGGAAIGWTIWTESDAYQIQRIVAQGQEVRTSLGEDGAPDWAGALVQAGYPDQAIEDARANSAALRKTGMLAAIAEELAKDGKAARAESTLREAMAGASALPQNTRLEQFGRFIDAARALSDSGASDVALKFADVLGKDVLPTVPRGNNRAYAALQLSALLRKLGRPEAAHAVLIAEMASFSTDLGNIGEAIKELHTLGDETRALGLVKMFESMINAYKKDELPRDGPLLYAGLSCAYKRLGLQADHERALARAIQFARQMPGVETSMEKWEYTAYFKFWDGASFVPYLVDPGHLDVVEALALREGEGKKRIQMLAAAAGEASALGRQGDVARFMGLALRNAREEPDQIWRAEMLVAVAQGYARINNTEQEVAVLLEAVSAVRSIDETYISEERFDSSEQKLSLLIDLSSQFARAGQLKEGRQTIEEAEALSRRTQDDPSYYLRRLAGYFAQVGELKKARGLAEAVQDGDDQLTAFAGVLRGYAAHKQPDRKSTQDSGASKNEGVCS